MTHDEIIEIYKEVSNKLCDGKEWCWAGVGEPLQLFAKLVAEHERERIKQANAPEIERINAHIKELEDAVKAEREACVQIVENEAFQYASPVWAFEIINDIKARGQA
jgi:hypothetical protein